MDSSTIFYFASALEYDLLAFIKLCRRLAFLTKYFSAFTAFVMAVLVGKNDPFIGVWRNQEADRGDQEADQGDQEADRDDQEAGRRGQEVGRCDKEASQGFETCSCFPLESKLIFALSKHEKYGKACPRNKTFLIQFPKCNE